MTCGMNREYAGRHQATLPVEEYLRIVEEKTGALFAASCEIGSVLAGLPVETARTMSEFGRDLGYVFQIVDDLLDFTGDPRGIGKPVGTDFRLGFATLPFLLALERGDRREGADVARFFARGDIDDAEWERARRFVLEAGGADAARDRALEYAESARANLRRLNGSEAVAALLATVEYLIDRGH
jgi:geranylgeranyl pyrophosphate synthase